MRSEVVVPDVARAFLLAGLAQAGGRLVVVTTATTADAEALAADVAAFCGPDSAAVFPAWETLPHERLSPRSETVAARAPAPPPRHGGDRRCACWPCRRGR